MRHSVDIPMSLRIASLSVGLLLASVAGAETIYKYRDAGGKTTYSNRLIPGAELIEAFEYRFSAPVAAPQGNANQSDAAGEARIRKHLAALDAAWAEVQEATKAFAVAEERLRAGVEPLEGEGVALGGAATQVAPEVGGPQASAAPGAGGPQPPAAPGPGQTAAQAAAASRAVGGPLGTRRGGGRNPEYLERMAALEANVKAARARLDAALRRYNQLR